VQPDSATHGGIETDEQSGWLSSMPKRVVFIRHAQSEENVKFAALMEGVQRIGRLKLPRLSSVSAGFKLLRTDLNSSLSPLGKRQVLDQALNLREARFLDDFDPQLILVSPLDRAKDTLAGLLKSSDRFKTIEFVVLECLREATPLEHLVSSSLERRISEFQALLLTSTATRILVCGHSQYFKRMLKMSSMMRNVDVWSATLDSAADSAGRAPALWSNLKLEHRSALSPPHPMDKGREEQEEGGEGEEEEQEGRRQHTVSNNNVVDDLHDQSDEPVCRICQASRRETPTSRFIRPCSCSGSLAHVHLECLNRWRATSASASARCDICHTPYQLRRTRLAEFFMTDYGVALATGLLVVFFASVAGVALHQLSQRAFRYDLAGLAYSTARIDPSPWRECQPRSIANLVDLSRRLAHSQSFRSSRPGVSSWLLQLKAMGLVFTSQHLLMDLLLCNHVSLWALDVGVVGLSALAAWGGLVHVYTEVVQRVRRGDFQDGQGQWQLASFAMTVMSFATSGAAGRLGLVLGVVFSIRAVYGQLELKGRALAQRWGEVLLEPLNQPSRR